MDTATGSIGGWTAGKSMARWKLPDLPPGGYEVYVMYLVQKSGSAEARAIFKEAFYTLSGPLPVTASRKPQEINFGTLRIKDGQAFLTLEAGPGSPDLHVYSVALVPANR